MKHIIQQLNGIDCFKKCEFRSGYFVLIKKNSWNVVIFFTSACFLSSVNSQDYFIGSFLVRWFRAVRYYNIIGIGKLYFVKEPVDLVHIIYQYLESPAYGLMCVIGFEHSLLFDYIK